MSGCRVVVSEARFPNANRKRVLATWSFGWPFPALCEWSREEYGFFDHITEVQINGGQMDAPVWASAHWRATLPIEPVWTGFVLNTLLYASIAWCLCQVPPRLRRLYRLKHNRCPQCGYSRTGLAPGAPCPECGSGGA